MNERYEPHVDRAPLAAALGGGGRLPRRPPPRRGAALRARDVPVSRPARCTWGTGASTRSATPSPATSGCAGYDVIHPIGFDALGLPAENAAIKDGRHPAERTRENIVAFRAEMKRLGYSFDWDARDRHLRPRVLPLEPVVLPADARAGDRLPPRGQGELVHRLQHRHRERAGGGRQPLRALRVAGRREGDPGVGVPDHRLRAGPARRARPAHGVARAHHHDAAELDRQERRRGGRLRRAGRRRPIDVFTTRVDTIFGCTYVVLAPEHPLVERVTVPERRAEVRAFVERMRKTDAAERTGEDAPKEGVFTGAHAVNPYTGEKVPVWIANFVLAEYGTGAVMSVPAHDQRDFEFAKKYGAARSGSSSSRRRASGSPPATRSRRRSPRTASSRAPAASPGSRARRRARSMAEEARAKGFGQPTVRWHLRDWGFSRQRYWGTPIPVVYCDGDGDRAGPGRPAPGRAARRRRSSPARASRRSRRSRRS